MQSLGKTNYDIFKWLVETYIMYLLNPNSLSIVTEQ